MYLETQHTIRQRFVQAVQEVFDQKISEPTLGFPPSVEMGDLSITSCFELAKQLRQAPRKIAEQIAVAGVEIDHVQMALAELAQPKRHARERPHERRVHDRAVLQVHHELAMPAVYHFLREFLHAAAVQKRAFPFDFDPDDLVCAAD